MASAIQLQTTMRVAIIAVLIGAILWDKQAIAQTKSVSVPGTVVIERSSNSVEAYKEVTKADGLAFNAEVESQSFAFHGLVSGRIQKLEIVGADGKHRVLDLKSHNIENGEIQTALLGIVRVRSSDTFTWSYSLTKTQRDKARAYLDGEKVSPISESGQPTTPTSDDADKAAVSGDLTTLKGILSAKPQLIESSSNWLGLTLLHEAARSGHSNVASYLLASGANPNAKDSFGRQPLFWAALFGNRDVLMILIERTSDVNLQDRDGQTALHAAATNGNKAEAIILLENGADPKIRDRNGVTPEQLASQKGHEDAARIIRSHGPSVTLPHTAQNRAGWWALGALGILAIGLAAILWVRLRHMRRTAL